MIDRNDANACAGYCDFSVWRVGVITLDQDNISEIIHRYRVKLYVERNGLCRRDCDWQAWQILETEIARN